LQRERGAAAVLIVLVLSSGVLLGIGALVVDVGNMYVERETLQSAADAAGQAVAASCTAGGCTTASGVAAQWTKARDYATRTRNVHGGVYTEVTAICGSWDALPVCPTPTARLGSCLSAPAAGDEYLEVRVRTQNAANTSVLPPTFAGAVLGGGFQGASVTACARYTARSVKSVPALWALATTGNNVIKLNGANTIVNGLVHSNADVYVPGNGDVLQPGTEYVTTITVKGNSGASVPNPVKVSPGPAPWSVNVADYRPGGAKALAAGSSYTAISLASCGGSASGTWTVDASAVPTGIVYVPCGIKVKNSGNVNATIVAEGPIGVFGTGGVYNPASPGAVALVSNSTATEAVDISGGANITINGGIQALNGGVTLETTGDSYKCGVIAQTILVNSNGGTINADGSCYGTVTKMRLTG